MYCQNCGSEIRRGEKFCSNCGAPVAAQQAGDLSAALKAAQAVSQSAFSSDAAGVLPNGLSDKPGLLQDFAVSPERYNLILGGTLLWGFVMNVLFCLLFSRAVAQIDFSWILVPYAVLALAGILLNTFSHKPLWSFVGYNLVVLPLGLVLSALIAEEGSAAVRETFQITAAVAAGMLLLSNWKPDFFSRLGPCLLGALLIAVAAELLTYFLGGGLVLTNALVALIFCGYIGYDWARAQHRPKTADNAIDSACALYLDIINLLLRVLASRSRSRRRD